MVEDGQAVSLVPLLQANPATYGTVVVRDCMAIDDLSPEIQDLSVVRPGNILVAINGHDLRKKYSAS